jgi:hypothetical protein
MMDIFVAFGFAMVVLAALALAVPAVAPQEARA